MRNAECGVRECLYSLVRVEVSRNAKMFWQGHPDSGLRLQKKGPFRSLQKRFFSTPPKNRFFCIFDNLQTLVLINEYGCLVKAAFFDIAPKRVKNRVKKNIVLNLP